MFIGEGPGYNEDQQGRPFVGRAGKLLDKMIAAMGLDREQVFIANVVKCRPPENRNPLEPERAACEPYLVRQISIIKPEVLCLLGRVATEMVLKKSVVFIKLSSLLFMRVTPFPDRIIGTRIPP